MAGAPSDILTTVTKTTNPALVIVDPLSDVLNTEEGIKLTHTIAELPSAFISQIEREISRSNSTRILADDTWNGQAGAIVEKAVSLRWPLVEKILRSKKVADALVCVDKPTRLRVQEVLFALGQLSPDAGKLAYNQVPIEVTSIDELYTDVVKSVSAVISESRTKYQILSAQTSDSFFDDWLQIVHYHSDRLALDMAAGTDVQVDKLVDTHNMATWLMKKAKWIPSCCDEHVRLLERKWDQEL